MDACCAIDVAHVLDPRATERTARHPSHAIQAQAIVFARQESQRRNLMAERVRDCGGTERESAAARLIHANLAFLAQVIIGRGLRFAPVCTKGEPEAGENGTQCIPVESGSQARIRCVLRRLVDSIGAACPRSAHPARLGPASPGKLPTEIESHPVTSRTRSVTVAARRPGGVLPRAV